jgi:hypothetical protein
MKALTASRSDRHTPLVLIVTVGLCLAAGTALAQESPTAAPPKSTAPGPTDLRTFALKHASPERCQLLFEKLYPEAALRGTRVSADEDAHRVLVRGAREDAELMERLIATVDVEHPELRSTRPEVRAYALRHIKADDALASVIGTATRSRGQSFGDFAIDPQRNQIVLSGPDWLQSDLAALLKILDVPAPRPAPPPGYRVRVVWLVSGTGELPAPPSDLGDVVSELAKVGFEKPRLAAQTIVTLLPGTGPFRAEGTANIIGPLRFRVQGELHHAGETPDWRTITIGSGAGPQGDVPELQLSLEVRPAGAEKPTAKDSAPDARFSHLETRIRTPPGHFVVLGMTPSEALTSAYIVQVVPESAPAGK